MTWERTTRQYARAKSDQQEVSPLQASQAAPLFDPSRGRPDIARTDPASEVGTARHPHRGATVSHQSGRASPEPGSTSRPGASIWASRCEHRS